MSPKRLIELMGLSKANNIVKTIALLPLMIIWVIGMGCLIMDIFTWWSIIAIIVSMALSAMGFMWLISTFTGDTF